MNGSGSAPITMDPGCPHGVQQTILAFGVLRGMTVMLGVGFGYPCPTYVPCLFAFRASADEETEMPREQTSNPSMTDVLLLLAITIEFLHCLSDRTSELLTRHSCLPGGRPKLQRKNSGLLRHGA